MPFARPAFERKIHAPQEAARWAAELARPLVFTNGVFDLLHRGHVTCLAQARALGAALLVALNGDASAHRLGKGPHRPLNALEDRMALVASLEAVDAVTWFDDDTPLALIEACRPEVLVKGGDWPAEKIVGAPETLARGGRGVERSGRRGRSSSSSRDRRRLKTVARGVERFFGAFEHRAEALGFIGDLGGYDDR